MKRDTGPKSNLVSIALAKESVDSEWDDDENDEPATFAAEKKSLGALLLVSHPGMSGRVRSPLFPDCRCKVCTFLPRKPAPDSPTCMSSRLER